MTRRWGVGARLALGIVSITVVAVTGLGWWAAHGVLHGITISQALGVDGPRTGDGPMTVLLIGLDSRKDLQGNDLPQQTLDAMHAGDTDSGGYNTNTLILAHVSADDRVVAFSIPRDDYVAVSGISGYDHVKIKEAYGLAKANVEQRLVDDGVGDSAELERRGREAGRAATLAAVHDLTGVVPDYFAEVSLGGFYDLASAMGGVDVCLNAPVQDDYSGADFPAGPQRLDAGEALAFVRQRHGLTNGDLDRTRRQQAFLVSVMNQLNGDGTFSDLGKLGRLVDVARRDVVLSSGWGFDQFRRVGAIAANHDVQYRTLPVLRYDEVDGQDVNVVDPAAIKAEVNRAFSGAGLSAPVSSRPSSTVDVLNAGTRDGLAAHISGVLVSKGYAAGEVGSPAAGEPTATAVTFGRGADADAAAAAAELGIASVSADGALPAGRVRITLGDDYDVPAGADAVVAAGDESTTNVDSGADHTVSALPVGSTDPSVPCVD